jgi:hypothetical protein
VPGVGPQQRGEDTDGGGLAGAVGAEDPVHRAGWDGQVHAVDRPGRAEGLGQTGGLDGQIGTRIHGCSCKVAGGLGIARSWPWLGLRAPCGARSRSLLKEVVDTTIAGDDQPIAIIERDWFRGALAAATAPDLLQRVVNGTGQIIARVAPILDVLRAAAAIDPEIAEQWPQDSDPRYTVHAAAAQALVAKPGARPQGYQPSTPPTCCTACSAPSCTSCTYATAAGRPINGSNGPTAPFGPSSAPADNRPRARGSCPVGLVTGGGVSGSEPRSSGSCGAASHRPSGGLADRGMAGLSRSTP